MEKYSEDDIQVAYEEAATHLEMSADDSERAAWKYTASLIRLAARERPIRIDGMTRDDVLFNIYAFGRDVERFTLKRDRARLDHMRAKWQKKLTDAKGYLVDNQARLKRFENE